MITVNESDIGKRVICETLEYSSMESVNNPATIVRVEKGYSRIKQKAFNTVHVQFDGEDNVKPFPQRLMEWLND